VTAAAQWMIRGRALGGLAVALLAVGCAHAPARSAAQVAADAATAARVYATLKASPRYFYPALEVRVDDGVAYLTGLAFDGPDRDAATWIARDVPGVRAVTNAISVVAGR
jgi:osmotically-inducible protein OsmY